MIQGLRPEYHLSVLDDDASCFTRGGNTGDGVSSRVADGNINLFYLACTLGLIPKFLLGLSQLIAETLVALQLGIEYRSAQAACIHIALPVVSGDDAALAILVAASQQCVGNSGVNVREQQGHCPTKDGVTRGVGTVGDVLLFLLGHKGLLVVVHKGTRAHILLFSAVADAVTCSSYVLQEGVQLGRLFLTNHETQNRAELLNDGLHTIISVTNGHSSAFLILALTNAPKVLGLVGSEA